MGEVQRYIVRTNEIGVSAGFESSHGPWVSHQDHAALVEATRVLVKAAERERDEARETIMGLEEQNKALRGDEPPATCSTSPCGKWFRIEYGGLATPWFKDVEHAWEHVAAREKGGGR